MQANHRRTAQARAALKHYLTVTKRSPDTMQTDITDLVTDLYHLAHSQGLDWGRIAYNAEQHFVAETKARQAAANGHGRSIKNPLPSPLYNEQGEQIREVTQAEIDWTH